MAEKTIALLGQPNSGKSTLFNGLTGSRQHVGNWPGKTVERKDGFFSHNGITYKIVDLPGTYSLSANSDEEVVTRNYISSGEADLVCILADASQLNRSLFMLADYAGIHVPVVLLLNMMDVAEGQGKKINVTGLQKSLGIPVVPMVAADKKQYQPFFNLLENLDKRASFLNAEVRYGFLNFLVPYYTNVSNDETGFHIAKFMRELKSGDVEAFMERLKIFFSGIPYELSDDTECHYQVIFHVVFTLLGQFIRSEVRSSRGRADAVVHTPTAIYVFEFKLDGTADAALKQIDEKGYLIPYTLDGRKLVKVGVNFSKETRNIDEYIVVEE